MQFAKENFGVLWPVHVDALVEFLCRLRSAFDGDLDAALIMAVVGSAAMPRTSPPTSRTYDEYFSDNTRGELRAALNTHSVTEITGIPRETVRRKLVQLERKGWVSRDEQGFWKVDPKGTDDLAPMTEYSLEYLARIAAALRAILTNDTAKDATSGRQQHNHSPSDAGSMP